MKKRIGKERIMTIKNIILSHRQWVAGEVAAYKLAKKIVKHIESPQTKEEK